MTGLSVPGSDSYWSAPFGPENVIPNQYIIPAGSTFGGLNDRFGVGDLATSLVALSRLSLIPLLDSNRLRQLNSEAAFKAQLSTKRLPYTSTHSLMCHERPRYLFPPIRYGVIAAISSTGPLSRAKCRPCTSACKGRCVARVRESLQLCSARWNWEKGWERIFDQVAGRRLSAVRESLEGLRVEDSVRKLAKLRARSSVWDAPPEELCKIGLDQNS